MTTILIACDTGECEQCSHDCKQRGWIEVHTIGQAPMPTCPVCGAPWRAGNQVWTCSKCGLEKTRKEAAGW